MFKIIFFAMLLIIFNLNICFAYVESGKQEYTNLKLEYPLVYLENKDIQDKINTDIASYVYALKGKYDSGEIYSGWMKYQLKYEDEQYLSVTITSYWYYAGAAHGMYNTVGLVFDKNTGNRIPLSYFVPIQSPQQLEYQGVKGLVTKLYNGNMQRIPLRNGWSIKRISQDYFLNGNGTIYLIYQPYELGPFSDGNTYVEFTPKAIDYFKRMK